MKSDFKIVSVVLLAVLASGCVSINVNHEIHKDSSSDVGIEVESDSQVARTTIKEVLESSMAVENAVLDEGDGSFSYRFENVYPQLQENRFSDTLSSDSSGETESSETDSAFDYEKDPGLLYTHFTIRINSTGTDSSTEETDTGLGGTGSGEESELGGQFGDSLDSTMEFNYNIDTFGTVVDTNGQEMSDGSVRFDLTEDKDYYVEFKALSADLFLSNLGSSTPSSPEWDTSEWGACSKNGTQTRTVELQNDAENFMFKPQTQRECEYTVQKDLDQMLLDGEDVEGLEKFSEEEVNYRDTDQAFKAVFGNEDTNVTHYVLDPSYSTSQFLSSESKKLEENDYESDISFIEDADNSTAYSKVLRTETTQEGSGYYSFETDTTILRQKLMASRFNVVHILQASGEGSFGDVNGVDVDSLAEKAIQKTE